MIKCCRDCIPPERSIGCHGRCKKYKEEKAETLKEKQYTIEVSPIVRKGDFTGDDDLVRRSELRYHRHKQNKRY